MRNPKINYAAVGGFVMAMFVAFVGAVAVLAGRGGAGDDYFTVFPNVADLKYGTQVRFEGYPVGQITEILPTSENGRMAFRVRISVAEGWQIPADSIARVNSTNMLASKTLDIESGKAGERLSPGDQIRAGRPNDVFVAMADMAEDFSDLKQEAIGPLVQQLTGLLDQMGDVFAEDVPTLVRTVGAVAATIDERLPAIAANLENLTGQLVLSANRVDGILSPETVTAVGRIVENAEHVTAGMTLVINDLMTSSKRVDAMIANIDAAISDNRGTFDAALNDARYSLQTVAQNIDAIMHNLDGSSRNLTEFSRLIRRNPSLLISSSSSAPINPNAGAKKGTMP